MKKITKENYGQFMEDNFFDDDWSNFFEELAKCSDVKAEVSDKKLKIEIDLDEDEV